MFDPNIHIFKAFTIDNTMLVCSDEPEWRTISEGGRDGFYCISLSVLSQHGVGMPYYDIILWALR